MTQDVTFPSYDYIKRALLRHLERSGPSKPGDVYDALANDLGLSPAQRTALRDDAHGTLWQNKVQWARQSLKNNGYMAEKLGTWELSKAGKAAVLGKLNLKPLTALRSSGARPKPSSVPVAHLAGPNASTQPQHPPR